MWQTLDNSASGSVKRNSASKNPSATGPDQEVIQQPSAALPILAALDEQIPVAATARNQVSSVTVQPANKSREIVGVTPQTGSASLNPSAPAALHISAPKADQQIPNGHAVTYPSLRRTGSTRSRNGEERVHVEFFVSERQISDRLKSLYFKSRCSVVIIIFNLMLKLAACILYVIRVVSEGGSRNTEPCEDFLLTALNLTKHQNKKEENDDINWKAIIWVHQPLHLWIAQVAIAVYSLLEALLMVYLQYKGSIWKLLSLRFFLELVNTVPLIITLFNSSWKDVFIPVFLNCWLAKLALADAFNHQSLHNSQTAFSKQVTLVMATLFCFVFTSACGFQQIQRGGQKQFNILESIYFVIISLATVGYGDVVPDIWPAQLFVIGMVVVALIVIPRQFESLAVTWLERQKMGGSFNGSRGCAGKDKHVVVCATEISKETLLDFVNEFYSHRHLQDYYIVVMTPNDMDPACKQIFHNPLWSQRLVYLKGSCLRDIDLLRAKMKDADACFLLGVDNTLDKETADGHTVLRSWAVQDYAPSVPQYVQIFRPENKVHVQFAEFVTCEDEFKYAMLAYNCMIPGSSSLFTLLLHTSKGEEGQSCENAWLRLYGKCSGNEIYSIMLKDSVIFGEHEGKLFTTAAELTHKKFGVTLIGVQPTDTEEDLIMLNPGNVHTLKGTDLLFYLSITREEDMTFFTYRDSGYSNAIMAEPELVMQGSWMGSDAGNKTISSKELGAKANGVIPKQNTSEAENSSKYDDVWAAKKKKDARWIRQCEKLPIITDYPPVTPYIGTSPTLCYIMKQKKSLCCLEVANACEHSEAKNISDYKWGNPAIIIIAEKASGGIFNFLVPLRTHYHLKSELRPIVLLLEKIPNQAFLDCIAWFPLVYWRQGAIDNIDDLLKAGINFADNVVVLNKNSSASKVNEEDVSDCNTIVAVQTVFKFFPNIKITTELSQSANMRFMQFEARNPYTLYLAEVEKKEKAKGSHISFMFRMQFAAGNVFSASMVDTLLYQAFVKDYIMTVVRLLLGIDQTPGSGFLTSLPISKEEPWSVTYGSLFHHLCSNNGDIPIAIYRTHTETEKFSCEIAQKKKSNSNQRAQKTEINNLIRSRMSNLDLTGEKFKFTEKAKDKVSYVVINPDADLNLQCGDIIYVIKAVPTTCTFR